MQSYYMQIKDKALPFLDCYKEDITKHDRNALRGFKGRFIHGSRKTGTDIILLNSDMDSRGIEISEAFTFRSENSLFHYGINGVVKKITKDRAIEIFESFKAELRVNAYKPLFDYY